MATKSMQRTLDLLSSNGISAFIVEKFNPYAGQFGRREDFMGFIDIIVVDPGLGILGVQACGEDWGSHVRKITEERRANLDLWTSAGGKFWLVGWRKLKQRNKDGRLGKREMWVPRVGVWYPDADRNIGVLVEHDISDGYICNRCATRLGAVWPDGHVATSHHSRCPVCYMPAGLCSIDDWDWPAGSGKPGPGTGRD